MKRKTLLLMLLMALFLPWANAQQSLPYSYGFEDNDLSADGWEIVGATSSSTMIIASAAHTGSYGFQFYYSEHNAHLMSPLLTGTNNGVALSFYYKEYSSSYGDEQFYVGYTTDESNTDPTTFTYGSIVTASTSWQIYETTLPANVKRIAIKYVYNDAFYLYLDDFTFEAPASCVKPTGLEATLTPGNGTIATLNWTAGGNETAWVLEYGTASDFTGATSVNVSGTPTKNLTGLTDGATYYARVKANCGGGDYSDWCSDVCTFTPTSAFSLTVNDGTTTNAYVPYYAYYHDSNQRSEFIIPASSLETLAWGTITSMKFYPNYTFTTNASVKVYLMEVEETTFSDVTFYTEENATVVYNGTLAISTSGLTITFNGDGYQYGGGNLLVGFYQASGGSGYGSSSNTFYGVSATGASISYYSTNSAVSRNFLPKTTFSYLPGEEPTCFVPKNLAYSNVTGRTVDLEWTEAADATAWQICINGDEENLVDVTTNPYTLGGLEPETDYAVKVRANCGDGDVSGWSSEVTFTTDVACHAPTDLTVTEVTAHSASFEWSSDDENFDLRYTTDINPSNDFETSEMLGWTNIDADGDGYEWVLGSQAGGVYLVEGGSLAGTGHNASEDMVTSGSYSNYTGSALTPDNYLVSPQINLGGSISFWASAQDASYSAEHFGVAVSTTSNTDPDAFTTIQEWTMTAKGSGVPTNHTRSGNRAQGNWYQYTVDLSQYSGKGYVAIRHFDCTDLFMLNVDDIVIDQPGINWTTVTNITNPYTLTGLDPETAYWVQVRTNCGGDDGESVWVSTNVTTYPTCMIPVELTVSEVLARSAKLQWTETGEATVWQICINGDERNPLEVTTNPYTLTGLNPDYDYTVKVRANCGDGDLSHWSEEISFTTDVSCHTPAGLTVSDITAYTAFAEWTGETEDYTLRYAQVPDASELDFTDPLLLQYDDGSFYGGVGSSSTGTWTWGVMYPGSMVNGDALTKVSIYENSSYNTNTITINVYTGGDNAPETWLYSEEVTPNAANAFHEITLATPVLVPRGQNLWITLTETGTYVMAAYLGTEPNNQWVNYEGTWYHIDDLGVSGRSWMIRGTIESIDTAVFDWTTVDVADFSYLLDGLTPVTSYILQLRSNCGGQDGSSAWIQTSFTTDVSCHVPTDLTITKLRATYANLAWEGESNYYNLRYRELEGDWINKFNVTSPFSITGLTPETDYEVEVQANCGNVDGLSEWAHLEFTTPTECQEPDDLTATKISSQSATLTWTGYQERFNVRYRIPEHQETFFFDDFENGLGNWTIYTEGDYNSNNGNEGWLVYSSGYNSSHSAIAFSYSGSALDADNWLVTPLLDLQGTLKFYAKAYSSSWCDSFEVLLALDGNAIEDFTTVLQEMGQCPSSWQEISIDLSEYAGQQGYIAIHHVDYNQWGLLIDDFGVYGETIEASDWVEKQSTDVALAIQGLEPLTPYEAQVQGVCAAGETDWTDLITFTTLAEGAKAFVKAGNWNVAGNWMPTGVPTVDNDVYIYEPAVIPSGIIARANNTTINGGSITIKDGGQLKQSTSGVTVTVEKNITGYGDKDGGYYLLTTPLNNYTYTTQVAGIVSGNYDLYSFSAANPELEWRNHKTSTVNLAPGNGYLYANKENLTLKFTGSTWATNDNNLSMVLTYTEPVVDDPDEEVSVGLNGFVLVGNPYVCEGYLLYEDDDDNMLEANFYTMNAEGDGFELSETMVSLAPAEGAFIQVAESGTIAYYSDSPFGKYNRTGILNMNLNHNGKKVDQARVRFGEGKDLDKMLFNEDGSMVYIPQDDKSMAVVYANEAGMLPINMEANEDGQFTLSFSTDAVEFSYLHLIDNTTGADIDLLADPDYLFTANRSDAATRFTLVYATKGNEVTNTLAYSNRVRDFEEVVPCLPLEGHNVTTHQSAQCPVISDVEQTLASISGWGWFSSYVEYPEDALQQMMDGIAATAPEEDALIKSMEGFVMYRDGVWSESSTLTTLHNEQMYLINTEGGVFTLTGPLAKPEDHPITLASGWNWIGFISDESIDVVDALQGITPNVGDIIKAPDSYAEYSQEYGWMGSLVTLMPGQGYIYLNQGEEDMTLIYPDGLRSNADLTPAPTYWMGNHRGFPTNLTMTVTLDANQIAMSEGSHEIGAFVNGECRGSARLQKVNGSYVAFLTVSGEEGEEVIFRLFDVKTSKVFENIAAERISYTADAVYGNINNPMRLHFNTTGLNEFDGMVSIYPNPSKDKFVVSGVGMKTLSVYNTLGQLLRTEQCYSDQVELNLGSLSAGVYTVSVTLTNGQTNNMMIVKE